MSKAPFVRADCRHCPKAPGLCPYTRNLDKSCSAVKVKVNGQRAVRSRAAPHRLERLQVRSLLITDMVSHLGFLLAWTCLRNGHAQAAGLKICWLTLHMPSAFIQCARKVTLNGFSSEGQESLLRSVKTTTVEKNVSVRNWPRGQWASNDQ